MTSPSPPLHALLRPWLDALVQMRIRPVKHALGDASPAVSIVWMCPRDHHARSFEAIELFILLAKADAVAWRSFVEELQAASGSWFAYQWASIVLEPEQQPHVVGVDLVCTQLADATTLTAYLSGANDPGDAPTNDYKSLRAMLTQNLEDTSVPVRLRIKPGRPWRANMMEVLPAIAELGRLQTRVRLDEDEDQVRGCRLASRSCRVVGVHNDIAEFTRVDDVYLDEMMTIHCHGIQVADLPPLELVRTPRNTTLTVNALNTLLGTSTSDYEGSVQRVVMSRLDKSLVAPGLLSAVAFSQSVREIAANFQLASEFVAVPRRSIYWLAFALFSPHASHNVVKTRVNCDSLTSVHVQWMQELLVAEDPLQLLFSDESTGINEYKDTRISTSKVFLEDVSVADGEVEQIADGMKFQSLRVLGRSDGWWSVLLPGWGRAWVRDGDATVSSPVEWSSPPAMVRPIQKLELWGFREDNKAPVLQLLQLIGDSVQALELLDRDGSLDAWCPGVFEACPNLGDLHLWQASSEDLLGFAESCISGHCKKLKRLSVGIEMLTEEALGQLTTLLHILADESHPMAKQLQIFEFDVFCMVDGQDIVDSTVLTDTLQMLENNRHLSFFKLHLPLATSTPESTPLIKAAFDKQHDILLLTAREPMSDRSKASFLSVVWGQSDQAHPISAMELLDPSLITSIFEFVPDRRRRLVDVAMPRAVQDADM